MCGVRERWGEEENGCVVVCCTCDPVTIGSEAAGKGRAGVEGKVSLSSLGAASSLTLDCQSEKCFG